MLPRGQNGVILAYRDYPFCATRTSPSSNQTSMFKFHPVTIPPFYYVTVYPKEVDMGTRVAGTPIVTVHGRTCSCKRLLEVLRSFIVLAPNKSFYLVVLCRRKLYVSISNRVTLQTSDSLKSPFSYKHPL